MAAYHAPGSFEITQPGPNAVTVAAVQYHVPGSIFIDAVIAVDENPENPETDANQRKRLFSLLDEIAGMPEPENPRNDAGREPV